MKNQNVNVNALVLATYLSQQGFLLHDTCTCIDQTRIPSNLVLHYFLVNVLANVLELTFLWWPHSIHPCVDSSKLFNDAPFPI